MAEEFKQDNKDTKKELNEIKEKLKSRLNELNKNTDESQIQEKEATQKAYNIVQENINIKNENNKEIDKEAKDIAKSILNKYKNNEESSKTKNKVDDIVSAIEKGEKNHISINEIDKHDDFNDNYFCKINCIIHNCINSNETYGKKRNWTTSTI